MKKILLKYPGAFLAFGAIIGLLAIAFTGFQYIRQKKIIEAGSVTSGIVKATRAVEGRRGSYVNLANIIFTVDESGQKYQKRFRLSFAQGKDLKKDGRIEVYVLEQNPKLSRVDTTLEREKEGLASAFGIFGLFTFSLFAFRLWRRKMAAKESEVKKIKNA